MNFMTYVPNVIMAWRDHNFREAVTGALPANTNAAELQNWMKACREASIAAGIFDPDEGVTVLPERIQALSNLLGQERFLALYDSPPPVEVIDFMLEQAVLRRDGQGSMIVYKGAITDEVLRGRIKWEERFAEAGVPRPHEHTRKLKEWKTTEQSLPG